MKKFLCFFGAFSMTLISSCSDDNDNASEKKETSILPKTLKYTYPDNPDDSSITTFTYNGNKMVSAENEYTRTVFTYEGNVIVKKIQYDMSGDKISEESYSYNGGKLASSLYARNFTAKYPFGEYKGRYAYVYNPNGTIKKEGYITNATTGVESSSYYDILTFQNGNLVQLEAIDLVSTLSTIYTKKYEYDVKNNPFKNVLGLSLLLEEDGVSLNNLVKNTSNYGSDSVIYKATYEYNLDGYAAKKTEYSQGGTTVSRITEYTY